MVGVEKFEVESGSSANLSALSQGARILSYSAVGGSTRVECTAGQDAFQAGLGADTFVFRAGHGRDVVQGFQAGAGAGDVLNLAGLGTSYNDLMANHVTQVGADLLITYGTDTIKLVGVGTLHADDVTFLI